MSLIALGTWLRCGSIPPELLDLSDATSTIVVDRRGVPLYEALSGDGTRSVRLSPESLPPALVAATLAAEDRRFWSHPGVDPIAIARALKHNAVEGRVVEGGSTITQQVAKLLVSRRSPGRSRGLTAKIREAVLALRLEHQFDKREILAMYLNLAAYGNQLAGASRASRAYFGCDPSLLTPAQAAFLAGLPQRPSMFNPYRNRDSAVARQRAVLRRMEAGGMLSRAQAREARDEQLALVRDDAAFLAPHFVEMVLASTGGAHMPPAHLVTTIDAELQADIAGIIRSQRAALDRHGAANVAVVVLDNHRGEWLAWEGSGNYFDAQHGGAINGPLAPRQPGSTLKPFAYALAFEEGFTPASVLPDIPSHFPTAEPGVLYSPRNYDGRYRGPLLARRALAGSENVPAVALTSELGVPKLLRLLARTGFSTFDRNPSYYGLGVALGNAEVRLDELVAAYSMFARGGRWVAPTWQRWDDRTAGVARSEREVISARTAYWITDVLSDPAAREYIFGRGGSLEFPSPVAVKTGTSQAYHDNWTIGYTRDVTVGVWVGNFDRTPLRQSTGVTGAAPIFHAVMFAAGRRVRGADPPAAELILPIPDDLPEREICALSGMAANVWCPSRQRERLPPGEHLPCSWHHLADNGLLVVWPPEYRQWAAQAGLLQTPPTRYAVAGRGPADPEPLKYTEAYGTIGPQKNTDGHGILGPQKNTDGHGILGPQKNTDRHGNIGPTALLRIVNPPAGAVYLIDPTLRREFQTLAFRATVPRPGPVEWLVNDRRVGTSPSDDAFMWPLAPGTHRITARSTQGYVAETTITVR